MKTIPAEYHAREKEQRTNQLETSVLYSERANGEQFKKEEWLYDCALQKYIEMSEKKKRRRQEKEKEGSLDLLQMILANTAERLAKLLENLNQRVESI
jgi:hypothetical protein